MTKTNNKTTATRDKVITHYIDQSLISKLLELDTVQDPQTAGSKLGYIAESTARMYLSFYKTIDRCNSKIQERKRKVKKLESMLRDPEESVNTMVSNADLNTIKYATEFYAKQTTKIEICECIIDFLDAELVQPLRGSNINPDMVKADQAVLDSLGGGATTDRKALIDEILGRKPLVEVKNK